MTFLEPVRLWLLLLVPVLVAVYLLLQWRRKKYASGSPTSPCSPGSRRGARPGAGTSRLPLPY